MAQRPAAGGEQPDAELFVGGPAAAEDGEAGGGRPLGGRDRDDADLVRAPVPHGPERIRVPPQELGTHGLDGAPFRRGGRPRPRCRSSRRYCSTPPTNASPPPQAVDEPAYQDTGTPLRDMLPRQRRPGGGTGGAHRMRMRPWQEPGHGSARPSTTEADLPGVAASGSEPRPCPGRGAEQTQSGHSRAASPRPARPALFSHSRIATEPGVSLRTARRGRTPHDPPGAVRGSPGGSRLLPGSPSEVRRRAAHPPGAPARTTASPNPARAAHSPGGVRHLPDRFAARGDWGGGLPQPAESSSAGRPTQDPWKRFAPAGPERTAGRTATHQEHGTAGASARLAHGQHSRHPEVSPLNGRDAANYAGFTMFSAGRHIPRGSAKCVCGRSAQDRTWGEHGTNAARLTVTRRPSVCRGVAHVQGATRAEREARHRSRPRGNQQRRARPAGQRPRGAARSDASLRQDLGGPVGRRRGWCRRAPRPISSRRPSAPNSAVPYRCTRSGSPTPIRRRRSVSPSPATWARRCARRRICTGWISAGRRGGGGSGSRWPVPSR